jgi:2-hydroxychromene-2-carboxylate isomerase
MKPDDRRNGRITARMFVDPTCPIGYSASPALRMIDWRYGQQIEWQMVVIGLSAPDGTPPRFQPAELAARLARIRDRHGMPFRAEPKARPVTSERACRALVATRLFQPGFEWRALRALQLAHFTSPVLIDEDRHLEEALRAVAGLDVELVLVQSGSDRVDTAYRADHAEARSAGGGAAELQGKTARSPEGVRFTAPTIVFERGGLRLEAGGFQPVEAYDVLIANLDPGLDRRQPAENPEDALRVFPDGLTTREVVTLAGAAEPGKGGHSVEAELIRLQGEGKVLRTSLGNDALWLPAERDVTVGESLEPGDLVHG